MKILTDYGIFGWNYWYLITHPWVIIQEFRPRIKWFFQRGRRGYADVDAWNLPGYLSDWLPGVLRNLKDGYGIPTLVYINALNCQEKDLEYITCEQFYTAQHKWNEILENIANGFDAAKKINSHEWQSIEELEGLKKQMFDGFSLFQEYYLCLWD